MRPRGRTLGLAAAGIGAAAGVAAGLSVERRVARTRRAAGAGAARLGSLRSRPLTVAADDGVRLHAEVDEARTGSDEPTLVFVHGYALNLDCWHFQRAHFRGSRRMVFYDQRSHGRSGRSSRENATIDQLGRDLKAVLDELVPRGPVVLVGHSMGGMTVLALAEQHPGLFGTKVVGTALMSTTAGGLRPHKLLNPWLPDRLMRQLTARVVAGLARAPELVDSARRAGSNIGFLATDWFAFGDDVPASYVEFVDEMLAQTSFDVLAEFFPNFDALDKFSVLHAFAKVPTLVLCGTKDLLTSIGHSRRMAEHIPGARLVECEGAGHMVIMERHERVNGALEALLRDVARRADASRAS